MANISVYGTVLHYADYRENDKMLSLLTAQMGLISVIARGSKRPKSPLLLATELFVTGEFMLFENKQRYTLVSASIEKTFYDLRLSPQKLACGTLMLQVCRSIVQENEDSVSIFQRLQTALQKMEELPEEKAIGVCNTFLFQIIDIAGFKPRIVHCLYCEERISKENSVTLGFDYPEGGVVCANCYQESIPKISRESYLELYKLAVFKAFSDLEQTKTHKSVLNILLEYLEHILGQKYKAARFIN